MSNLTTLLETAQTACDVLVIEDDPVQAEEMAGFLGRAGLVVETAPDGAHAMRMAELLRPRVVVLDYNLPDMTGVIVAERLKLISPDISVIMMSGRIGGLSENVLKQLGISVFVSKPVPLGVLRQAVQGLVQASKGSTDSPSAEQPRP
jgi:DNA-binding response OmpR family regulator